MNRLHVLRKLPLLFLVISLLLYACSERGVIVSPESKDAESAYLVASEPVSTQAPGISLEPSLSTTTLDTYTQARMVLVDRYIVGAGINNEDVLQAMRNVPRHAFVPADYVDQAYEDHPLPIGYGQTISQPYIVAWMTELLDLQHGDKVLEIGTGSGYQAAILVALGYVEVYSIEIVPELAEEAARRLEQLGYGDVHTKQGDGYYGWVEYAPFDAIIVTAAPDHLPAPLAEQLAEGGQLVIPIGPPGFYQSLWKFVKENGTLKAYNMGGVAFVPFTGPGVEQHPVEPTP